MPGTDTTPPTVQTLEGQNVDQEIALKQRELDLKEREIETKEAELRRSRWLNPMVIGLFATAIGLIGNIFVTRVNNETTQQVERLRGQSNLILEAIRTGTQEAACKNLAFFVDLKLLDDPGDVIKHKCEEKVGPWLPLMSGVAVDKDGNLYIADIGNQQIRKIGPDGKIITLGGNDKMDLAPDGKDKAPAPKK